jgi:hypothetical protein
MPAVIEAPRKTPGLVDAPPPLARMDAGCTGQGLDTAMHLLGTRHVEGSAKSGLLRGPLG